MIAVRIPTEIEHRLLTLAERTGRTKSFYVREALVRYIEDLEDIYDAERIMSDVRAGKQHLVPLDEVERELGLAD